MVPIIVPEQLSVVIGGFITVTAHSPVISAKTGIIGALVSFIVIFWMDCKMVPFPKSKFQVTV